MPASSFNSVHASVDPRGMLIRDLLDEAGEVHGRAAMALAHERVTVDSDAIAAAVVAIIAAEAERMATVYVEAGCSRRQVRAFVRAYCRGAVAANAEASVLLGLPHHGSA